MTKEQTQRKLKLLNRLIEINFELINRQQAFLRYAQDELKDNMYDREVTERLLKELEAK